ncbi:hypothetical protein [Streptomyces tubercidicus]|uniref:Uncharacterized protein n=1 Tax=Streptomyces tubercidicus TaxID=47759 RepID=A0A640V0U7_9ACTN|nr:hypothetical protein [Streptomyces tubercidicus]WAU15904.1 hypothetical protein STRTU_006657 [Streptomyces tubercidicus]GFE41799.1 hypothetical protein Stube_64720 [Streptomyces tubercidicus]
MANGEQGADGRALSHAAGLSAAGPGCAPHIPVVYSSPKVYSSVDDQGRQSTSPVPQQSTRGAGMPLTVIAKAIAPTATARGPRRPTDHWEAVS